MVLDHVADGAGLFVEGAAALRRRSFSAIVIWMLSMQLRFQIGSRNRLANRKLRMLSTGSLPT